MKERDESQKADVREEAREGKRGRERGAMPSRKTPADAMHQDS